MCAFMTLQKYTHLLQVRRLNAAHNANFYVL